MLYEGGMIGGEIGCADRHHERDRVGGFGKNHRRSMPVPPGSARNWPGAVWFRIDADKRGGVNWAEGGW